MNKSLFYICWMPFLLLSCVKSYDPAEGGGHNTDALPDVEHFLTAGEFEVPVTDGYVTQVIMDGEVVAEAVSPMTIMLPRRVVTKAGEGPALAYIPVEEYPNELENKARLYQVVCFEDSRAGDYDYNDLVIHVMYKTQGDVFGFGVQPIALGSAKPIKLGCAVFRGETLVFKGLVTPDGKDCRTQHFESQEGFINTVGSEVNQQNGGWHGYLASTIRNWDISKVAGRGAMRVEWYIEVDGGTELYALSTKYLNQSFDKNGMPCGLVITDTGTHYMENGTVCGYDWFNYPKESKSIKDVYPAIWEWLTTDRTFDFADIYSGDAIPAEAYPAADLGLYTAVDADVCNSRYRQN